MKIWEARSGHRKTPSQPGHHRESERCGRQEAKDHCGEFYEMDNSFSIHFFFAEPAYWSTASNNRNKIGSEKKMNSSEFPPQIAAAVAFTLAQLHP
jgi:hypothetical protein